MRSRTVLLVALVVALMVQLVSPAPAVEVKGRIWILTEAEHLKCEEQGGCAISTVAWMRQQLEEMFAAGVESQRVKCGRSM